MVEKNPLSLEAKLTGNRLLRPGENYSFILRINHIDNISFIRNLLLCLDKDLTYEWAVNDKLPIVIKGNVSLGGRSGSWYPFFFIDGFDQRGYDQKVEFRFPRPVISTHYQPLFDAMRMASFNFHNFIEDYQSTDFTSVIQSHLIPNFS